MGVELGNRKKSKSASGIIKKNLDCILLTFLIGVLAIASCVYIYNSKFNNPPIRSDGFGYYAYLPTLLIDHNLSFRLAIENNPGSFKISQTKTVYGIGINQANGRMFDKYPLGTAMLETPFFIIADTYTKLTGGVRTGYSTPYQVAIVSSGIFYLCLGSLFLYITIRRLFGKHIAQLSTIAIVFATNVIQFGTYDNAFSQIYAYAAIALYLYLLFRIMDLRKNDRHIYAWLIITGLCLGLISTIRLIDSIVALLLIPVLLRNKSATKLVKHSLTLAAAYLIALIPTLLYLKHTTGSIFTDSYHIFPLSKNRYEGFTNLGRPQIMNFLFSVKKGLFFWSPILLPASISVLALIKKMRGFGISVALVLCFQVYLCASWWDWQFGGGFGSRPFVEMMPLFGVALATGIYYFQRFFKLRVVWVIVVLLIALNGSLIYSYWRGYIPIDETNFNVLRKLPTRLTKG